MKILLLPQPTPTISYRAWAQDLRGFCPLRWYCERLLLRYRPEALMLACHGAEDAALADSVVAGLGIFVALCESETRSMAIAELVSTLGGSEVAIIGLESMFAPSGLLDATLAHHRAVDNDFTAVADQPANLCPEVIGSRLAPVLASIFRNAYLSGHALQIAPLTSALANGPAAAVPYRSQAVFGAAPVSHVDEFVMPEDVDRARQAFDNIAEPYGWEPIVNWMRAEYTPEPLAVRLPSSSRKRVLYLSGGSVYAGAEECQRGLVAELVRHYFDGVALVSAEGLFTRRLREAGCDVIAPNENLMGPRLSRGGTVDLNFELAGEVLDAVQPWLVYINGSIDDVLYRAAKERGLPIVTHVRTAVVSMPERVLPSDLVITVSDYARRCYLGYGIPAEKLTRVYDGVDVERFAPGLLERQAARRLLHLPARAFLVLMIARCAPNKRHDLAVCAAALLHRAGIAVHLVFAGSPGDPDCAAGIRKAIVEEQITERVTWMPFQDDIRPLICAADAVILPSDEEPLGTCILEAMSLERPVIVSDSGGTVELIEDSSSGLVMRGGDAGSLAEAMRRLAGDTSLANQLARNGRDRVCERFSIREHGRTIANLLSRFA